jgi:hypothetical protein
MTDQPVQFTAVPVSRTRRVRRETSTDDQWLIIRAIRIWLEENPWHEGLTVVFDHDRPPDGRNPQQPSLYTGPKLPSAGWPSYNGAVDILVRDEVTHRIPLIVEAEIGVSAKKVFGDLGSIVISDRHVPSYANSDLTSEGSLTDYCLRDTLVIILSFGDPDAKIKRLEEACRRVFRLPTSGVSDIRICSGPSRNEAIANCKSLLRAVFFDSNQSHAVDMRLLPAAENVDHTSG